MRNYPIINMPKTGQKIKNLAKEKGYTVKELQQLLQLSCPQPVYRWMQGKILPTVEHLYAMSKLFGVHMEDLLVGNGLEIKWEHDEAYELYFFFMDELKNRFIMYFEKSCMGYV